MNLKQKVVVWIGLLLIVAMGVYPPWLFSWQSPLGGRLDDQPAPYSWILAPPAHPAWVQPDNDLSLSDARATEGFEIIMLHFPKLWSARLNRRRIVFQWAMVAIVMLGLVWTLGDKRSVTSRDEE